VEGNGVVLRGEHAALGFQQGEQVGDARLVVAAGAGFGVAGGVECLQA
jgi:hypothetical protein